jgi:hypothetical protein
MKTLKNVSTVEVENSKIYVYSHDANVITALECEESMH